MKNHNINLENLTVNEFRQRCFVRRSNALYGSKYTYLDDLPEQIEALEGFTDWESFSELWDIYWVGLDPRKLKWVPGRHNSPKRKIVVPIRLVEIDERNKRMIESFKDKAIISKMPIPTKNVPTESDEDRIISDSLSGKVVIDEPDRDKAIRAIEANMVTMQGQLARLKQ